jgi:hypothetical protein
MSDARMTNLLSSTQVQVRTCACRHDDARTCYEIRYPPPMDDLQRADYFELTRDEECTCCCHQEYEYDFHDDIY